MARKAPAKEKGPSPGLFFSIFLFGFRSIADGVACRHHPETLMLVPLRPLHLWREARQDRVDIAAGFQPENRAAVVEQVELYIAAAADQLLLAVGLSPVLVEVLADEVVVDDLEGAADVLREAEIGFPAALFLGRLQSVIKDAANAAGLVAVRQEEVLVAPLLAARVVGDVRVLVAD